MFVLFKVHFLEELLSAFVTPLILCFQLRRKSLQIIDFLRNFTVDVQGVGDVCSFAQLDVTKHGDLKVIIAAIVVFFFNMNFL
jgi:autophagy-related protein 9